MTVKNGEHLHAVPDVDDHGLVVRHIFGPKPTQGNVTGVPELYLRNGHVEETGEPCVVIAEYDPDAGVSAFATVGTDPSDVEPARDEVRIHFLNSLHGDPDLLQITIDGALRKLREEGMLPSGLAAREVDLTLEADYPRLDPALRSAAKIVSLWGEVHVADHVEAPHIVRTAA